MSDSEKSTNSSKEPADFYEMDEDDLLDSVVDNVPNVDKKMMEAVIDRDLVDDLRDKLEGLGESETQDFDVNLRRELGHGIDGLWGGGEPVSEEENVTQDEDNEEGNAAEAQDEPEENAEQNEPKILRKPPKP